MSRLVTVLGVLAILVLSMGFAALNGGQLVTLRLGVVTFYRIPLTLVAFGALILGMLVMLVASIHSDLKVRRILRDRLAAEDEAERARIYVDRAQQDLFEAESAGAAAPPPPSAPTPDPDLPGRPSEEGTDRARPKNPGPAEPRRPPVPEREEPPPDPA